MELLPLAVIGAEPSIPRRRKRIRILLELIEEPRETEQDGKTVTVGMSYNDTETILEFYNSVVRFTQGKI